MIILTLALAQATAAAPVVAPAPPAEAKTGRMQAAFDDATAAYLAKDWRKAIALFDALDARLGPKTPAVVRATIAMRRGVALAQTGQDDRAIKALAPAIATIPADDENLGGERTDAQVEFTRLLLRQSDFAGAAVVVSTLRTSAKTPDDQLSAALLGLRATMFDPGNTAVNYADEAASLAAAMPTLAKSTRAEIDTLRARLMLNRGQNAEGFALLKKALSQQGGLDTRVSLTEVATRSDIAIAALLNKNPEAAREYLAYTGQGRIQQSPFGSASSMAPPSCGGDAALAPDDLAVVEFGIDELGAVMYANTIYMSHPSARGAQAFANAVRSWSWQPDTIAKIPSFYKLLTRVELRCTNAVDRPSFAAPLDSLVYDFASSAAEGFPAFGMDAASKPAVKAELTRRSNDPNDVMVAPLMIAVGTNAATSADEAVKMFEGALARLPAAAPARLRAALAYRLAGLRTLSRSQSADYRAALRALLAQPAMAADPVVSGVLRLEIARAAYQKSPPADAIPLVQAVADDSRLDADDPLKTAALLQLANLQAAASDTTAARATLARTGLSADQCALLDTPPAVDRSNVDSGDFPMEAQRWGFEGWVRLEQDILSDGRSTGTRAIIAYPPFVFRDAGVKVGAGLRYLPTFRPGSTKGCTGVRQSITFRMQR